MSIELTKKGFTLIELLIVIVIVGILLSFAIPSYYSYLLKSRRADAKQALASLQLAQEKWRGNHDTYANSLSDLGISTSSNAGYYVIQLTPGVSSATTYEATATANPNGPQASDTCGVLKANPQGFLGNTDCWGG